MVYRPDLSFSLLTAFAALARSKHFGRAAEELGMAQPALSQQLRRMETVVGGKLVERDTRNVQLTAAGVVLHDLSERLLREAEIGIDRVRRTMRGESGRLAVGFTATTGLKALPAAVELHRSRNPDIQLDLLEFYPDTLCDRLASGEIDVGLIRNLNPQPELELFDAGIERYVAVIPSSLAVSAEQPLPLAMLRNEPFMLFRPDRTTSNSNAILQMCAESDFAPRTVMHIASWQSAISFVSVGLGVAILPTCTSFLRLPNVSFVPIDSAIASRITVVCRRGETRTIVSNFVRSAVDAIAAQS